MGLIIASYGAASPPPAAASGTPVPPLPGGSPFSPGNLYRFYRRHSFVISGAVTLYTVARIVTSKKLTRDEQRYKLIETYASLAEPHLGYVISAKNWYLYARDLLRDKPTVAVIDGGGTSGVPIIAPYLDPPGSLPNVFAVRSDG